MTTIVIHILSVLTICNALLLSAGISCPECGDICDGKGFLSCDGCICQPIHECSAGHIWVLQQVTCVAEPCPRLPNCMALSTICNNNFPLIDVSGTAVACIRGCPASYECIDDICCTISSNVDVNGIDSAVEPVMTDTIISGPPSFLLPDLMGDVEEANGQPCNGCTYSPCLTLSCPSYVDARCVQDNCSCLYWFVDHDDNNIDCSSDIKNPEVFLPEVHLDSEPTLEPKTPASKKELNDQEKSANNTLKYWIIAACVIVVMGISVFAAYRFFQGRRKSQSPESSPNNMEQKVPLKEMNTTCVDNNNEAKSSKLLMKQEV